MFTIHAFYTPEYEEIFYKHLWPSIKKFELSWNFQEVPSEKSWHKNTALKAKLIYDSIQEGLKSEVPQLKNDIVFLDADAEIVKYPSLFNEIPAEYDLACHYLSWEQWYGYKGDTTKELLSGTLFLRKNKKVAHLVKEWYNQAKEGKVWEQKILANLIKENKDIKVYELPLSYCYIGSRPGGLAPLVKCSPVIIHHQASRTMKKLVGKV